MKSTAQSVRENEKLNLNVPNFLLAGSKVLLRRPLDSWPELLAQTHGGRGGPEVPPPLPRLWLHKSVLTVKGRGWCCGPSLSLRTVVLISVATSLLQRVIPGEAW